MRGMSFCRDTYRQSGSLVLSKDLMNSRRPCVGVATAYNDPSSSSQRQASLLVPVAVVEEAQGMAVT